ncbi:MAG: hypothetical protein IID33_00080 [Planctomycetes bacterium]|nr:hypothetical protein [Planctomycetota bacterium]
MADTMTSSVSKRDGTDERRPPAPAAFQPRSNVRFVTCVVTLLVSAVSMQTIANTLGQYFRKRPVPLRRPLSQFDKSKLAPDFGLHVSLVPPITDETLQALGTEEYAQLRIVDLSRDADDPVSVAHFFITYYTGQPDLVPHVPDECYQAGGYELLRADNTQINVPGVGAEDDALPIRVVTFGAKGGGRLSSIQGTSGTDIHVLYFFLTNGEFVTTRNQVRVRTANLLDRHAYFAKFEVRFSDHSFRKLAGEDESLAAMAKLMRTVLPILLGDHFVDWDALKATEE